MNEAGATTTDARLLDAAVGLFASQGFAATSVRQVCEQAGGNVAAVNYHFRSKNGPYDAAIDHARASSVARNEWVRLDTDRNFWADADPQTHLRRFVAMLLDQSLNADGKPSDLTRILIHEMLDPTESFDRQVEVSIGRVFDALCEVCRLVAAEHGCEDVSPGSIARTAFLVSAQCMYPALVAGVAATLHPAVTFDRPGRAELAEQISSAAITALGARPSRGRGGYLVQLCRWAC